MTSANVSNVPVQLNISAAQSTKSNPNDAKTDFMNVMNQSVGSNTTSKLQITKYAGNDNQKVNQPNTTPQESYQANNGKNEIKSNDTMTRVDEKTKNQVTESVKDFADEVNSTLKEELDVSDEDISGAMEMLGLSYIDLIDPANMTQLVTQLTGSENAVELLMNPNFSNVLDNLQALTGQLLEETNMTLGELTDVMKQIDMIQMPEMETPMQEIPVEENSKKQSDIPVEELQSVANVADTTEDAVDVQEVITQTNESTNQISSNGVKEDTNTSDENETVTETKITVEVEETPKHTSENETGAKDSQRHSSELAKPNDNQMNLNAQTTQDVTYNPVTQTITNASSYVTDVSAMMEQIVQAAKVSISLGETTMEMILNPESLGKLYMQVTEKEGSVSAHLYTQNEAVKEALESQMIQLKENLNQQGVKVDSVEVSVGTHEFERNLEQDAKREEQQAEEMDRQAQGTRSRNINLNNLDDLQGLMTEEEELAAKIMRDNGNTVNYTA